ncbi:hypothetical protein Ddye_014660 [Dipteronia dyeriana]|uniref:NAC domain-containing protein n=1 Tax=Dipteronia dyeriana TaxID=168575 RepID=A0AAE0CKT5_9ROSI|nr:hypothetical protein Ddye_014660 [Dipteronia dyeriana]
MTTSPMEGTRPRKRPRLLPFPPGYRFLPSDTMLIVDYLMKKLMNPRLSYDNIIDTNIYKYNPWDLAGIHESQGSNQWYFFTSRDRKYPKGTRPNRAAGDGYWKATGAEKKIYNGKHMVGVKNSLVFCKGKPSNGEKTPWLMHEYLVHSAAQSKHSPSLSSNNMRLNDWVLCKIYKKPTKSNTDHYKNHFDGNGECTSPFNSDDNTPLFHSPEILDNRDDDDTVAIQPVYTIATDGIAYLGSEMVDPLLGFEDVNAWNMPEMVDPPLGFEDDDNSFFSFLLLDGSLRVLDLCSTAKDALVQIKEFTQELQSILRRRGDTKFTSEIKKYLTSRKALRKAIEKALENSKAKKLSNENESVATAGILKEVEIVSLGVFESLWSFISGPKAQSKLTGWSLVSKLTHHKRRASEEGETESNEFAKVDAALLSLIDHKIRTADVQNQLKNLELCIQGFDEGLECLSRRLIKTRVSLLNALNN